MQNEIKGQRGAETPARADGVASRPNKGNTSIARPGQRRVASTQAKEGVVKTASCSSFRQLNLERKCEDKFLHNILRASIKGQRGDASNLYSSRNTHHLIEIRLDASAPH